ncbi:MAG: hypothetical protein V2A62_01515 [Candidatus Woesearchaeota archaeon]
MIYATGQRPDGKRILLFLIVFISACTPNTTTNKVSENVEVTKWTDYVASGKSYECNVTITQGEVPLEMKIYLKGKYVREEMTVEGSPIKIIFKNNLIYSLNEINMDLRDEFLKDCDWIIYSTGETTTKIMSEQFYDISTFEEIGMAKYICKGANFGNEKFDISGKVCDISAMISSGDE